MKEKNRGPETVDEQGEGRLKDDSGNIVRTSGGPDFNRLLVAVAICVSLLIIAKFFVL